MTRRVFAPENDYVAVAIDVGVDEAMIERLVRRFYGRVRADPLLAPVFDAKIAAWEPHLERMCAFWSAVMLRSGRYHGQPMPKHAVLPVWGAHFDRWLALFEQTARETCADAAPLFIDRAQRIAQSLELGVATARGVLLHAGERLAPPQTGATPMTDEPAVPTAPAALIDHILERYHETHRRELPELIAMAEKVERVHAAHPQAPKGLAALLKLMSDELDMHMRKEEAVLFPMMRQGAGPMIAHPIARMRIEHDDHNERVRELKALTDNGAAPADACRTWRALYAGTRKLTDDLAEHIRIENEVLFPQFASEMPTTPICPGMLAQN